MADSGRTVITTRATARISWTSVSPPNSDIHGRSHGVASYILECRRRGRGRGYPPGDQRSPDLPQWRTNGWSKL